MKKIDATAVIFAGGRSSRMGQDKALLPFGSYNTLAEYQYSKLSKIFKRVYISAKSDKFNFKANIIKDCYPISSPLIALISIFETIEDSKISVLSVDTPFIKRDIMEKIYNSSIIDISKDIIVAKSKNGMEPLCGIYRRNILPIAKELLAQKSHRLMSLIEVANSKYIDISIDDDSFINLNYPEEYKRALTLLDSNSY